MRNLTKPLFGGVALCALATAPATAGNVPAIHVIALHDGRPVTKTILHDPHRIGVTTSIPVFSRIHASDLHKTVKLTNTYYKYMDNNDICTAAPTRMVLSAKNTAYAKLGTSTETHSFGCPSGPGILYGDTYKLTNPAGVGQTDFFVSRLIGRFTSNGVKYRGDLIMDVNVEIDE
jgi:hypothetical protein